MATDSSALSMKLLIDRKAHRVLFAEASKEVVDFLFSLLVLPVATAVKLVGKEKDDDDSMAVGCFGNLYASVEKLDSAHVRPGADKDALLRPVIPSPAAANSSLESLLRLPPPPPKAFFKCPYNWFHDHNSYVTDASGTVCPSCGARMTRVVKYVVSALAPSGAPGEHQAKDVPAGGFVQGNATYTVTDNLAVSPVSAISGITSLLNTFAVRDLGDLQEKTVQLGHDEGVAILKASMQQSKTVLTDVFLGKKQQAPRRSC